ncbi:MAG: hypothetical protein NT154_28145 [Verrucomicrobia bacterium]|nr:hypothetical protein [Verrucomicrobiota bacterium]
MRRPLGNSGFRGFCCILRRPRVSAKHFQPGGSFSVLTYRRSKSALVQKQMNKKVSKGRAASMRHPLLLTVPDITDPIPSKNMKNVRKSTPNADQKKDRNQESSPSQSDAHKAPLAPAQPPRLESSQEPPSSSDDGEENGEYFAPEKTGQVRYGKRLDDEDCDYLAPDMVQHVVFYEGFPYKGATGILWHYCAFDPLDYEATGQVPWPVGHCANGCPGHASPDEAREHFRKYLVDKAEFKRCTEPVPCRVCGRPTQQWASLAGSLGSMGDVTIPAHDRVIALCQDHLNRKTLGDIFRLSDFQEFVYS